MALIQYGQGNSSMLHKDYPTAGEVDDWCERLLLRAEGEPATVRILDAPSYTFQLGVRHNDGNSYVAFETPGRETFYGYWQLASAVPAPVLFHVPGYGAEMSAHPELVSEGFNVLHVNPLGYATPQGPSQVEAPWPVLPNTVESRGARGYVDWLGDAATAVQWALSREEVEPTRFGFFGSSQGGGTSLLLASLFSGRGVRAVAADVPFLVNFPLMHVQEVRGAYETAFGTMGSPAGDPDEWKALGFIDALSHAHRLTMPTLLTAGGLDSVCPPVSIASLFESLPGTRSYTYLADEGHKYTTPFLRLAQAWFRLYV
jgi:cephalosporin-C deacetylase-like acetyl esterase